MSESSVSVSDSVSSGATAGTKLVYAMNKCLIDFVRHINPLDSELKKINKRQFRVIDKMSKDHMEFFRAQWIDGIKNKSVLETIREMGCTALLSHPDIASRELLPNIKVSDMVLKVPDTELPVVRFYLYVFSLFAVMYTDVMQHTDAQGQGKDAVSDAADLATLSHVLKIVQQIQDGTYQKEEDILEEIIDEDLKSILVRMLENAMGESSESEGVDSREAMNGMPEPNLEALQNTSIGALAKEISEDLDLSDLKIERPEDILNMAMGGGGGGSGSMVSSIISKVGSKIQEKMQKGELKQEDLLRDAFSFLNTFSGGTGGGGSSGGGGSGSRGGAAANPMAAMLNNPMMQQMMNSMMGGGGMGGLGGLAASLGGGNHSSSSTRDRLRKKYESSKK